MPSKRHNGKSRGGNSGNRHSGNRNIGSNTQHSTVVVDELGGSGPMDNTGTNDAPVNGRSPTELGDSKGTVETGPQLPQSSGPDKASSIENDRNEMYWRANVIPFDPFNERDHRRISCGSREQIGGLCTYRHPYHGRCQNRHHFLNWKREYAPHLLNLLTLLLRETDLNQSKSSQSKPITFDEFALFAYRVSSGYICQYL